MKAKLIVENGLAKIVLTPETTFERNMIDDLKTDSKNVQIETTFQNDYRYQSLTNQRIEILLTEKPIN